MYVQVFDNRKASLHTFSKLRCVLQVKVCSTGRAPSPDTSDRAVCRLLLPVWGSGRVPLWTEVDPALCSCSLWLPADAGRCHTRGFSPGRERRGKDIFVFDMHTGLNARTKSSLSKIHLQNSHTFSLTISPVSLAWAFESPLACLLHSTRGSWRKVFSTLRNKIKKAIFQFGTEYFRNQLIFKQSVCMVHVH